jgi:hypothetical protein
MRAYPLVPPPLENPGVEAFKRVMESIDRMTDDELWALAIRAGIYTEDGRLTRKYGGTAEDTSAAA